MKFIEHNSAEQTDILARKLPNGLFWLGKYISCTNLRKILIAYGLQYLILEQNLNYASRELSISTTSDLIENWEEQYGIATSCFASQDKGDLDQRITNILTIIRSAGTSTKEQFEALAQVLGVNVEVFSGIEYSSFTFTFPILFIGDDKDARFTMVVKILDDPTEVFPYTFPFPFGDPLISLLKCFFKKLKPANVRIIYVNA